MTYTSNVDLGQLIVTGIVGVTTFVVLKFMRLVGKHIDQVNGDHRKLKRVAEVVDHHSHVFLKTTAGAAESFLRVGQPGSSGDYDDIIKANQ